MQIASFGGWPNRTYEVDARPCQMFSDRLDGQPNPVRRTGVDGAFLTSPESTGGEFLTRPLFSCIHWQAGDNARPWEKAAHQDAYAAAKEQIQKASERVSEIFRRPLPQPPAIQERSFHVGTESYDDPALKKALAQDGVPGYEPGQWK